MRHQARGDVRAARDLCQSAADVADFGQAVDGDFDQLDARGNPRAARALIVCSM